MCALQLLLQRSLVEGLEIRVSTNVLLADENVWYGALIGHLLKRVLNC